MGVQKSVKKGKKPHKNKPTSKKYTKYKIDGDTVTRTCLWSNLRNYKLWSIY